MLIVKARVLTDQATAALLELGRLGDYAMASALTKTGVEIKDAERKAIGQVFDSPTPYTQNSVYLRAANRSRLQAEVWLKWGSRPEHYLLPNILGGSRPMKRFEQRLQMVGLMRGNERAVPGKSVPLDAYGNVSRGLIVKVLSQLRTAVVQGDFSNASNSKRSRAKRATVQYFVSQGPSGMRAGRAGRKAQRQYEQHLPRGIWERRVTAWGSSVRPLFLFVDAAKYAKVYDFFGVADTVIRSRFPVHIEAEARRMALKFAESTR